MIFENEEFRFYSIRNRTFTQIILKIVSTTLSRLEREERRRRLRTVVRERNKTSDFPRVHAHVTST